MDKTSELELIRTSILHCEKCGLREGIKAPVPMVGPTRPLVTIVGTGPDAHDIKIGFPWSGKSGGYTKKLLGEAGIDLKTVAWMNVVCCGSEPKQIHLDACRLNCRRQLQTLGAPYTLVFGAVASQALLPFPVKLRELRGLWWKLPVGGWAMSTYHPASTMHGFATGQEGVIKRDLDNFAKSVLLQDLHRPKLGENCIDSRCVKFATHYVQGVPFCANHAPRKLRKVDLNEQLTLDMK